MAMGELGWSPNQFWLSPLPDFFAAWRGYQRRLREQYWHTGAVVAALYNQYRDSKKHPDPYRAEDLYPFLLTPQERAQRKWAEYTKRLVPEDEE